LNVTPSKFQDDPLGVINKALVNPDVVIFMDDGGYLGGLEQRFKAIDNWLWIGSNFSACFGGYLFAFGGQCGGVHFRSGLGLRDIGLQIANGRCRVIDPARLDKGKDRIKALAIAGQPGAQIGQEQPARRCCFQGEDHVLRFLFVEDGPHFWRRADGSAQLP
jgi:hypothetical protein